MRYKSKHEIHFCFLHTISTCSENNPTVFFSNLSFTWGRGWREFSIYVVMLMLKIFQIFEHFGVHIFEAQICSLHFRNFSRFESRIAPEPIKLEGFSKTKNTVKLRI